MIKKIKKRILQELSYATGKHLISPEIVSLAITYRCNFRCEACTVWRMDKYPELSIGEWERAVDSFKDSLSRGAVIEISGGEPLLRKDLVFFLVAKLKGFFIVGINSNSSLLDESTVASLKKANIDYFKVSLYSLDENIHDKLRGITGAAKNAKRAIDLLQEQNIKTDIGVLMTSENISTIPAMIKYYNQPKYSNVSIILQPLDEPIGLPPVVGNDKVSTIKNLWPDNDQIKELFLWLEKHKPKNVKNAPASIRVIEQYYLNRENALNRRCLAGQRGLVIYPDGRIYFCYSGASVGNILKENLSEILSGSRAAKERKNIKKCAKSCRIIGCNFSKTIPEIVGF